MSGKLRFGKLDLTLCETVKKLLDALASIASDSPNNSLFFVIAATAGIRVVGVTSQGVYSSSG
jgi:hypothetical protein